MILLYTDFGWDGPYVGQMKAVLAAAAPGVPAIDLMHDAPAFAPGPAGRLLAAVLRDVPPAPGDAPTMVLAVVDPGVGTDRRPIALAVGARWFVGPDNGLFDAVRDTATGPVSAWRLTLRPARLSASFHGRDLFAPAAARIASGAAVPGEPIDPATLARATPPEPAVPRVLYIDAYGNAMLDRVAADLPADASLAAGTTPLPRARTFGAVSPGTAFWYENSLGLAEIAVNQGNAAKTLGLVVGTSIRLL